MKRFVCKNVHLQISRYKLGLFSFPLQANTVVYAIRSAMKFLFYVKIGHLSLQRLI